MKAFIIRIALTTIFFSQNRKAQSVGINNDGSAPNASAMLDVKHTNKGLFIPRVTLINTADITTITSPATSLLVYNTTATGIGATAVTAGYNYWIGSEWLKLNTVSPSDPSWLLSGNSGTIEGKNFGSRNVRKAVCMADNKISDKLILVIYLGSYTNLQNHSMKIFEIGK